MAIEHGYDGQGPTTEIFTEQDFRQSERRRPMDRLLPYRSFRRAAAIGVLVAGVTVSGLGAVLHHEVGNLQEAQQNGINGVKDEVTEQGQNIQEPLNRQLGEATQTLEEGKQKLAFCEKAADALGLIPKTTTTMPSPGSGEGQTAAAPPVLPR